MEEETTVKDLLKQLVEQNNKLIDTKEAKPWKMPWKAKVNKARVRQGYVTVQIIKNNNSMDIIKAPIQDGTILIDGIPRISTAEYMLNYKNKGWIILPEWSLKPFSSVDNYDKTEQDRMNVSGRRVVLAKLEKEAIKKTKGRFSMIGWIILGAVVLGVGYYLMKGGKIF